ncbi:hypothetical protein [Mycolicibacterium duvalii]|nr:hypothetical protein [Mycolicibacterium duvalii]MCV7368350.1 hypothetical protein [Mycolicibacterium duvalii]
MEKQIAKSTLLRGARRMTLAAGAVCVVAMSWTGVASADDHDLKADPSTPVAGPVAEKGIRKRAVQGEVRKNGDQGEVRASLKAVPKIRAKAFGNLGDNHYRCREHWDDFC